MTARAPAFLPVENDPVLRTLARAPIGEPETPEERAAVAAAKAEMGHSPRLLTRDALVASLCAHHGITPEEWATAGLDSPSR
jgi:predicted nucleic acid-binding protein